MILSYRGNFVKFGGSLVGYSNGVEGTETSPTEQSDELIVDGVKYETFRVGNYLWSVESLKYHLSTGSHTHNEVEFYRDDALVNVESVLTNGWKIPDLEAFNDLFVNRDSFNFIYAGYEDGNGGWRYNNDRCYMIGKDSDVPYLKYWFSAIGESGKPTFENPTIGKAYSDAHGEKSRFPLRLCKKVS